MKTFIVHLLIAFIGGHAYFGLGDPFFPYNAVWAVFVWLVLFFLLWLTTPFYHRAYFHKLPKAINFLFFFLKELVVANLKVAYEILTPKYRMKPTIIAIPLSVTTDLEIALLSNIISLTPGSLSIDVSADRKSLYMHTLYVTDDDLELTKQQVKHGFERRLMQLTR